jgi:RNA polymerase sigma-70 factor (ECF subfamily)
MPYSATGAVVPADAGQAELVRAAQAGSEAAFQTLYDRHKKRVYGLCLRMVRDAGTAEELTQEAFLQVFRKLHTFRGDAAFTTWLHRLAVNTVLMHLRRRSLPVVSMDETEIPSGNDEVHDFAREFGAADNALLGAVDRVDLARGIAQLPPGYRMVFLLHDVDGYDHEEIAQILGCSAGNCKSQLHKARLKLRKDLLRSVCRIRKAAPANTPLSHVARRIAPSAQVRHRAKRTPARPTRAGLAGKIMKMRGR